MMRQPQVLLTATGIVTLRHASLPSPAQHIHHRRAREVNGTDSGHWTQIAASVKSNLICEDHASGKGADLSS